MKNPSDVAAKWSRNMSTAGESIKQGVMAVTVAPSERAVARQDAYLAGVQRAVADGRYARGLRRVSLQSWQEAIITKGLPRISSGASSGKPKVEAFMAKWLPHQEQLRSILAQMPRGDLNQNIARMIRAVEHNAAFKYT